MIVNHLDNALAHFERGDIHVAMGTLHQNLSRSRALLGPDAWRQMCRDAAHPIAQRVREDPFTRRAWERPRGYAGDAELIDFLYQPEVPEHGLSPVGAQVARFMHAQPSAQSVRFRRDHLARTIDEVAAAVDAPRVVSIACGHLREASQSQAVREGRVSDFVAFDQDERSLEVVAKNTAGQNVRPVRGTVRSLLSGKVQFTDVDFVYSAGLFDYLSASTAARLTRRMFEMLRPGGRLLVANFAHEAPEAGYMELFMDWWLTYRDEQAVADFSAEVDAATIRAKRLFRDPPGAVIYLELVRA